MNKLFSVFLIFGLIAMPSSVFAGMDAGAGAAIAEADSEMGEFSREAEQENQVNSLDSAPSEGEALITDEVD